MILQIKLLSDLCASSGENYNAFLDTEIVYEDNGLPYIPGKRIKGCVREAALELVDFGLYDEETYQTLFGREGMERAAFSLDNAYLEDYEGIKADIEACSDSECVHPQRVLSLFSYSRTQTAMTKDGVADHGSLRTMRVVNKDLIFEADLQIERELRQEERELLETAISMVKHIGLCRTRGLGLVDMTLLKEGSPVSNQKKDYALGEMNKVYFSITLEAPVLCKSATGSQEKSHDYIEGSKIIGILASRLSQEEFFSLMGHDSKGEGIIVSNTYVSKNGQRSTPARASLQKQKDQTFDANGEMIVEDMLFASAKEIQYTPVGEVYLGAKNEIRMVDMETNYHHRRPRDKSIGKANGTDESTFYQLASIQKGQEFTGFIIANRIQAETVIRALQTTPDIRIGYGRNAEYGKARIEIINVETIVPCEKKRKEFVIKLNSPAILYNSNGFPSVDVDCLMEYVARCLGVETGTLELENCCLTYETIGGFNVTWNRRKPIFTALGKGTVCYFSCNREVNIAPLMNSFIGERVSEGYGEMEVSEMMEPTIILKKDEQNNSSEQNPREEKTDIISRLRLRKQEEDFGYAGVEAAEGFLKKSGLSNKKEFKAAFGKLLLIVKTEDSLEKIKEQINGIEGQAKKEICSHLLQVAMESFPTGNLKEKNEEREKLTKIYLRNYLNHIKYETYETGGRTS